MKPDMIIVMTDQHAARVAGCYGDAIARTPNIDRLAREGVLFENTYCPSPLCLPSRMAFMTGRYPAQTGCLTNRSVLPSDMPTFAHGLSLQGYRTCLAGRMHFVGPDQLHGFDERLVGDINSRLPFGDYPNLGPAGVAFGLAPEPLAHSGPGITTLQAFDRTVADAATAWLKERVEERRAGQERVPFCLVVGLFLPHPPFVATPESYDAFRDLVPPPALPVPESPHPYMAEWVKCFDLSGVTADATQRSRTAYYGMVAETDRLVGEVVSVVDGNAEISDSVVVYTSDHGDQLGERGLWGKSLMYDTSTRVPLIMRQRGLLPTNVRRAQNVSLIDIGATLLDLAGAEPPPDTDGRSLLGVAHSSTAPWDNRIFSEFYGGMIGGDVPAMPVRMIRRDDWKLTWYGGHQPQLFDLSSDPDETRDLADEPGAAKARARLVDEVLASWDPEEAEGVLAAQKAREEYLRPWYRGRPDNDGPSWADNVHAENRLIPLTS